MTLPVPHEPGALEIKQLYVLAPWQGAGVAAALMDWAVETARASAGAGPLSQRLGAWRTAPSPSTGGRASRRSGVAPFLLGTRSYQDPVMRLAL